MALVEIQVSRSERSALRHLNVNVFRSPMFPESPTRESPVSDRLRFFTRLTGRPQTDQVFSLEVPVVKLRMVVSVAPFWHLASLFLHSSPLSPVLGGEGQGEGCGSVLVDVLNTISLLSQNPVKSSGTFDCCGINTRSPFSQSPIVWYSLQSSIRCA